jgi:large subunit ribosomal protein L30e
MTLEDTIRTAVKNEKAIIGFKRSIKFIKLNNPKLIVIANNLPEDMRKEIEHNSKISKTEIEMFDGGSKELGVICGKPFPVAILVIKG